MASSDQERESPLDQFLSQLANESEEGSSTWSDASDLGRMHIQAFMRNRSGGFELSKSRGFLRLTGDGVRGHSLDLADAGIIMTEFQSMVTATGAALQGHKNTRGRIRDDVVQRTRLALSASPVKGSVILEFEAATDESKERYPNGAAVMPENPTPLIEESVDTALTVLAATSSARGNTEQIHQLLAPLGPRVAAATRALASAAAKARLDLNISWEKPGVPRKKVVASAESCATFASVLHGVGLDSEVMKIEGHLRTVSDRRKIDIETADPESPGDVTALAVDRGEVDFTGFGLGDFVEMTISVEVTERPGGAESRRYKALYVARVGEPGEITPDEDSEA